MLRILFKIKRRIVLVMETGRRKWFLMEMKSLYPGRISMDRSIRYGKGFSIIFDASTSIVSLGRNLNLRDHCAIRSGNGGKVTIGDNVFFNNDCSINCLKEIIIGNNNQFGENVRIYDSNHQYRDTSRLISEQGYSEGKIVIGNNCWISSNVVILKDVTIGDNVVIGANCVIYKSIPSDAVVIGKQELLIKTK